MKVNDIVKIKEVLVAMQDCLSNTSTPVLYIKLEEDLANRLSDFLEKLGYSTNVFQDVIKSSDEYVLAVDTSKGQLVEEKAIIFLHRCADDNEVIKLPFTIHVATDDKYFLFSEDEVDPTLVYAIVALYTNTEPKLSYGKDIRCFIFTSVDNEESEEVKIPSTSANEEVPTKHSQLAELANRYNEAYGKSNANVFHVSIENIDNDTINHFVYLLKATGTMHSRLKNSISVTLSTDKVTNAVVWNEETKEAVPLIAVSANPYKRVLLAVGKDIGFAKAYVESIFHPCDKITIEQSILDSSIYFIK